MTSLDTWNDRGRQCKRALGDAADMTPMNSSQGFIHSTFPQCGELTRLLLGNLAHTRITPTVS